MCGSRTLSEITLRPVESDLLPAVTALTLPPAQRGFVDSPAEALGESYSLQRNVPRAVLAAGEVVGFALYTLDPQDRQPRISRLLIDAARQGRGYGRAALRALLAEMAQTYPKHARVRVALTADNAVARRLFESEGFTTLSGDGARLLLERSLH